MNRSRLLVLVVLLAAATAAHAESDFDGHWDGAIEVPTGALEINVDFASDDAGVVDGDISIPIQSLLDVDLTDVAVEDRTIRFRIPGIPGDPW